MPDRLPFRQRLAQGLLLLDGAMGTLLHSKGVPIDSCFDELNLSGPAMVFGVHRAYIDAGAEIVETNTFGANRFKLAGYGLQDSLSEINRNGVELARHAVESVSRPNIYVAGSVGPLGVQLAPFGRVQPAQAYEAFCEQIEALCGADLLILETFSDLYELQEAVRAAKTVCSDKPLIAEVTFTRDDRTLLGDSPHQAAEILAELDVDVIGANCSNGPAQITRVVKAMQSVAPHLKFSAAPNAGWPEYVGGRVMYPAMPEYFAEYALALRDLGVSIVGGCCGTTPDHIRAMRAALDDPARSSRAIDGLHIVEADEEAGGAASPSQLAQKLTGGQWVVAVEMSPPKGIAAEKAVRAARMLHEAGADVVDVLDSPMARMRMSPWAVCHLLQNEAGIETVLHFPTRGRNMLRIQGDLLAAHAIGVRNLFVVMGDPTHIGDYPDAADNYDIVPSGLIRLIKESLNHGQDWAGNSIGQPTNFLVSSALNLTAPDLDHEIKVLRKKLDGGADYLITQPIFQMEPLNRFLSRYQELHGPLATPVLVGVMPLYGVRHATFLNNEVPGVTIPGAIITRLEAAGEESPQEGVKIAQEIALQLRERVAGLYLMPQFRRYDLVAEVIEAVRAKVR